MGGKGGGGGGNSAAFNAEQDYQNNVALAAMDQPKGWGVQVSYKPKFEEARKRYADEATWYANYGGSQDPNEGDYTNKFNRDVFTKAYGTYKPPAPAPVAAPAAPAPAAPAPAAPAPAAPDLGPVINPIDTGTPIEQPTSLGDQLGIAAAGNWAGGYDSSKNTKQGFGSLKTTQT